MMPQPSLRRRASARDRKDKKCVPATPTLKADDFAKKSCGGYSHSTDCTFATGQGSPFMVSGELFLRSAQELLFRRTVSSAQRDGDWQRHHAEHDAKTTGVGSKGVSMQHAKSLRRQASAGPDNIDSTTSDVLSGGDHLSAAGLLSEVSADLRDLLLCHPDLLYENELGPEILTGSNGGDSDSPRLHGDGQRRSGSLNAEGDKQSGDQIPTGPMPAPSPRRQPPAHTVKKKTQSLTSLVYRARQQRQLVRRERIEQLKASKTIASCLASGRSAPVRRAMEGYARSSGDERARLETRLYNLVLRFASLASDEMVRADAQTAAEEMHCIRETERLDLFARLAALAATAAYQTRGKVILRRLPPNHPQHARCLRAATENVKPGFFSSESPYSAVDVLDVFKIENRFLLERFQRAAKSKEPYKVKGLFCHVPSDSLENAVMYGMGTNTPSDGVHGGSVGSGAAEADWKDSPIDPVWACRSARVSKRVHAAVGVEQKSGRPHNKSAWNASRNRNPGDDSGGVVDDASDCGQGKAFAFPRAFSRYSTLEEEREYGNKRHHADDDGGNFGSGDPGNRSGDSTGSFENGTRARGDCRRRRPSSPPPPGEIPHRYTSGMTVAGLATAKLPSSSTPKEGWRERAEAGASLVREDKGAETRCHLLEVNEVRAGAEAEDTTVSGLRFLALCRVMISSLYVSPARRRSNGNDGGCGDSRSGCGRRSGSVGRSHNLEEREREALPPPPAGQAEYDAAYFPRDEEYRLLNESFVLPEFLLVHRFAAAPSQKQPQDRKAGSAANTDVSSTPPASSGTNRSHNTSDADDSNSKSNCGEEYPDGVLESNKSDRKGVAPPVPAVKSEECTPRAATIKSDARDRDRRLTSLPSGLETPPEPLTPEQNPVSNVSDAQATMSRACLPAQSTSSQGVLAPWRASLEKGTSPLPSCCQQEKVVGHGDGGVDGGATKKAGRDVHSQNSIANEVKSSFADYWRGLARWREAEKNDVEQFGLSRKNPRAVH